MDKKKLTESQQKVFDAIKKQLQQGRVPSIREICNDTGFTSTSTIFMHINSLERKGYIVREKSHSRSMRLANDSKAVKVPVLGKIRAGNPLLAVEEIEEYISVTSSLASEEDTFALKVVGDSMIKAGIYENDIVVAKKAYEYHNGEIVVALVGDEGQEKEATIKRYLLEDGKIKLVPENDNYDVMVFDNVEVVGKVISLIRNY